MPEKLRQELTFRFLITGSNESGYIGMCKETGFVIGGNTVEEVQRRLLRATEKLIEVVLEDERYYPSLHSGLSFQHKIFYYKMLLKLLLQQFSSMVARGIQISAFTRTVSDFVPSHG